MSHPQPTPQDDDATGVIADAAEAYFEHLERDGYRLEGCSSTEAAAFIREALKSAGYELGARQPVGNISLHHLLPALVIYTPVPAS